jgi:hypothetical protein
VVRDRDIERVLLTAKTAQDAANSLVRMAKSAGGSDNITAVVARNGTGPILSEAEMPKSEPAAEAESQEVEPADPPATGRGAIVILSVIALLLGALAAQFGGVLKQAGYNLQPTPPFAVKPVVVPPPPVDLAKLTYEPAVQFYPYPVRSEPLVLNTSNQSITVMTATGDAVCIGTDRLLRNTYPWSRLSGTRSILQSIPPLPQPGNWHLGTDQEGNVYVADAGMRDIMKYRATGQFIGRISTGLLSPESIAVNDNGDVYVIDGTTLKLLKAQPIK